MSVAPSRSRRLLSAAVWAAIGATCALLAGMGLGALTTSLDGHGLGFIGAIAAMAGFVPGALAGWRWASNSAFFWAGVALLCAAAMAANAIPGYRAATPAPTAPPTTTTPTATQTHQ